MQKGSDSMIKSMLELSKVKITFAVSLTTITGYVLANGKFDFGLIWVTLGIFFLACAASVLNHIQESGTDSKMDRTKNRPIPSGRITKNSAYLLFFIELIIGLILLYFKTNTAAFLLGILALIWYNLIYTYLKRVTAHAVIPGSVIGAIPPLAGWVAAGSALNDPRAWALGLFFFVWQVPHFYLLAMKYGSQYKKAGFPSLIKKHNEFRLRIMVLIWIVATAITCLMLSYLDVLRSQLSFLIIIISSLWLILVFVRPVMRPSISYSAIKLFMNINYFVLLIIIILNFDHILYRFLF